MNKKLITLAVASACLLNVMNAMAEDAYQGPWYLMPTVGVMNTDSDLKADDRNFAYGVRAGKELNEKWDIQLGLTNSKADEDSRNYSGGHYRQTMLGVDALYFFSREKFRPFVLAGVGIAHNKVNYNGNLPTPDAEGSRNSWMGNIGVGAQYLFTENFGMQADIRQVFSRARADGGLFGSDKNETVGNTYLNLGVIFRFGAPKQVVAELPAMDGSMNDSPAPIMDDPKPEPAKVVEPAPAPAPVAFEKVSIQAEVLFDFDKANLKPAGQTILKDQVVEKMKANQQVDLFLITGHADRIGSDKYNQKLSEQRAESVKAFLVSQGIDASRLHAVGKGESAPVVDCKGSRSKKLNECLQPNRRVELEIESQH